jgi:hypothetical protein
MTVVPHLPSFSFVHGAARDCPMVNQQKKTKSDKAEQNNRINLTWNRASGIWHRYLPAQVMQIIKRWREIHGISRLCVRQEE